MKKINIRESLLNMDRATDCKYDLTTLYEACNLDEKKKEELVKYVDAYDIDATNKFLSNEAQSCGLMEDLPDDDISDEEMEEGFLDNVMTGISGALSKVVGEDIEEVEEEDEDEEVLTEGKRSREEIEARIEEVEDRMDYLNRLASVSTLGKEDTYELTDLELELYELQNELDSLDEGLLDTAISGVSGMISNLTEDIEIDKNAIVADLTEVFNKIDPDGIDYVYIDTEDTDDGRLAIQIRTEYDYDELNNLFISKLDKIVQEYDPEAYFDFYDSSIIEAYIRYDQSEDTIDWKTVERYKGYIDDCETEEDFRDLYVKDLRPAYEDHSMSNGTWMQILDIFDDAYNEVRKEKLKTEFGIDYNDSIKSESLKEDFEDEYSLEKFIKKLGLEDEYDIETFVHDVNNLRGNEWLEDIENVCSPEEIKEFKEIASIHDRCPECGEYVENCICNDEYLEGCHKDIKEDTIKKKNGKWTNKGDSGEEHGTFKTKKEADAQRKAMFANGYKGESLKEKWSDEIISYKRIEVPPYGETLLTLIKDNNTGEYFIDVQYGTSEAIKLEHILDDNNFNWYPKTEEEGLKLLDDAVEIVKKSYKNESLKEDYSTNIRIDYIVDILNDVEKMDNCGAYIDSLVRKMYYNAESIEDIIAKDRFGESLKESWEEINSKTVYDSDGFTTDYTLYKNTDGDKFICIFGDKDMYEPDENYADWEGDSEEEAQEWFNSYEGLLDD